MPASDGPGQGALGLRRAVSTGSVVRLVVALLAIYVLWPSLVVVYSSFDELSSLNPSWFVAMIALEVASFAWMWLLIAICLRSTSWFLIGTTQVVGNAVGLVMPGGSPVGTATQIHLLTDRGFAGARATTGVITAGLVNLATLFALPVLAVPEILSGLTVNQGLVRAAWLGLSAFVVLTVALATLLLTDRPVESVGRIAQRVRNVSLRHSAPLTGLPERLEKERDEVRVALRARWGRAILASSCNWLFDYLALLAALMAVGVHVNFAVVLLAYVAAIWLATIPVTPGGIGFVEAGLLGMLILGGVPGPEATVATLAYRLVAYVGAVLAGLPTYAWYRRRLRTEGSEPTIDPVEE